MFTELWHPVTKRALRSPPERMLFLPDGGNRAGFQNVVLH